MKTLIIALTCILASFHYASAGESTLPLQEKCSKAAQNWFASAGYSNHSNDETLGECLNSYENHYNKKNDQCLILVQQSCYKQNESYKLADLVNVFEEKKIASYMSKYAESGTLEWRNCQLGDDQFNMMNGMEFNYNTKKWDVISKSYRNSLKNPFTDIIREKFDKWTKPYMTE